MPRRKRKPVNPPCAWCRDICKHVHYVGDQPRAGDFSHCCKCGKISVFLDDMTFRKATESEVFGLMMDDGASRIIG